MTDRTGSNPNEDAARRRFAVDVVRTLRDAGHEALWAGGCVRDQLLGLTPKDYDVATSAVPDEIRRVFGKKRTLAIGAAFGVITVLGPKPAGQIEVATFRSDAGYSDGRRPDAVTFTTAEHDASRRDFTINGLFFDPLEERVIDYVNGQQDLEAKIVRAIGDAEQRFDEDKLRMLRAVRFAAALGFAIEPATRQAIADHAGEIQVVSPERIGAELRRMLTGPDAGLALRLIHATGLLKQVLPELAAWQDPKLDAFDGIAGRLASRELEPALACLLYRDADAKGIRWAAMRLKFTKKESDRAAWIATNVGAIADADEKPWSRVQPLLASDGGSQLVGAYEALNGPDSASRFCRERLAWPREQFDPPPLVTGAELVRLGLRPGPQFSGLLQAVRDAQLDGALTTAEQATDWVRSAAQDAP